MISRREFFKTSGMALTGYVISSNIHANHFSDGTLKTRRPVISKRKFTSDAVEAKILEVKSKIKDEELAWLFENCFPNTLDTTVTYREIDGKPDTFVITGDINAMWLRDSTAQVWPYLPLTTADKKLQKLIAGVINRQTKCILIDPYANAFNDGAAESEWKNDITEMKPELHERKWEIDSLCYPVRLAHGYWKTTSDTSVFDADWQKAMKLILKTFKEQQRKENKGPYSFMRETAWAMDGVVLGGYGNPIKPNGLIASIFRPSDDATIFPFLIPSNFFAVVSLKQLSEIFSVVLNDINFAEECSSLAKEIETALNNFAVSDHKSFGKILAYEIDGYGNILFMDDANIPSLLSLPYLNAIDVKSEIYTNTRKFLFSDSNPYFFNGKAGEGIGGPHAGLDMIWHLSIIMRALTSSDKNEIKSCVQIIKNSHAGTGFMHESFHKDNANKFTRSWFAWANTLFGELIIKINSDYPELLNETY